MGYYAYWEDGYLLNAGEINSSGYPGEISETEYGEIIAALGAIPREDGKGYRLKSDLTWESYDLPQESEMKSDTDAILDMLEGQI